MFGEGILGPKYARVFCPWLEPPRDGGISYLPLHILAGCVSRCPLNPFSGQIIWPSLLLTLWNFPYLSQTVAVSQGSSMKIHLSGTSRAVYPFGASQNWVRISLVYAKCLPWDLRNELLRHARLVSIYHCGAFGHPDGWLFLSVTCLQHLSVISCPISLPPNIKCVVLSSGRVHVRICALCCSPNFAHAQGPTNRSCPSLEAKSFNDPKLPKIKMGYDIIFVTACVE